MSILGFLLSEFYFSCLTESPRWLIQHKKLEEASRILHYIAKINKQPSPDLSELELISKQEAETEARNRSYSFLDLFSSRSLTIKTLVMMYLW